MQRIKNIDKIIEDIVSITPFEGGICDFWEEYQKHKEEQKEDFLKTKKGKCNKEKNWYTSNHWKEKKNCKNRKESFFKKLQTEWWVYFCPYCWKNTITHFENNKWDLKKLYDIEHFLPKSLYSSLSINLYNWLPSCMSCNQRLKIDIDPLIRSNKKYIILPKKTIIIPWETEEEYKYSWNNDDILNESHGAYSLNVEKIFELVSHKNKICKNVKKAELTDYIQAFHPYFWFIKRETIGINTSEKQNLDEKMSFVNKKGKELILTSEHWKKFQLDKIYLHSEDTFQIFRFIYNNYTKIKDEYSRFKKNSKDIGKFVDYFLKHYYPEQEQDILKYSNWKLKKDLIEHMKEILKNKL